MTRRDTRPTQSAHAPATCDTWRPTPAKRESPNPTRVGREREVNTPGPCQKQNTLTLTRVRIPTPPPRLLLTCSHAFSLLLLRPDPTRPSPPSSVLLSPGPGSFRLNQPALGLRPPEFRVSGEELSTDRVLLAPKGHEEVESEEFLAGVESIGGSVIRAELNFEGLWKHWWKGLSF